MENTIYIRFHVGGGYARNGFFQKSGIKSFEDEKDFQGLLRVVQDDLFSRNRNEDGTFCKEYYADLNGKTMVEHENLNAKVGVLDWDGDYDTDIVKTFEDCTDEEKLIICNSHSYKSPELREKLETFKEEWGYY